jgi:prepilin-type processing-associated H-X9-DG protein
MSENLAAARLVAADLAAVRTETDGGSEALHTASVDLGELGGFTYGIWDAGPGTDVDVEADEVFWVLSGRGTVTFADGSVLELAPGVLVHLVAGDRTTWTITERLRKVYLTR